MNLLSDNNILEYIESLIESKIPENIGIEYKAELKINSDSDKKEFLADVTAFANTNGGTIIYGIKEEDSIPIEIIGIQSDDIDSTIQRIEQLLNSCVQPRIIGYRIEYLIYKESSYILIITIPQSWNSPHMVNHNSNTKFFLRDNNGKHQMSIDELRYAFKYSDMILDKIDGFIKDRIEIINNQEHPLSLPQKPYFLAHFIPIWAFQFNKSIDFDVIIQKNRFVPQISGSNADYDYFNIDGFISYVLDNDKLSYYYTQIFRNGIIETVDFDFETSKGGKFGLIEFTKRILKQCRIFLEYMEKLGIDLPIIISINIINAKGLYAEYDKYRQNENKIDRNRVRLYSLMVKDYNFANYDIFIKPILDSLWNACGFSSCPFFDKIDNRFNIL